MYKLTLSFILLAICIAASAMKMDSVGVARAELEAWQAYYQKNPELLIEKTAALLKTQYGIHDDEAVNSMAHDFFVAYQQFGSMPQNATEEAYRLEVQPLLTTAYTNLKSAVNAYWDPELAARADLAWWVARRQNNQQDPERVGEKIQAFYAVIYGQNHAQCFSRAAYLRAVAARYRDLCQDKWGGASQEDWELIQTLLEQSYSELDRCVM